MLHLIQRDFVMVCTCETIWNDQLHGLLLLWHPFTISNRSWASTFDTYWHLCVADLAFMRAHTWEHICDCVGPLFAVIRICRKWMRDRDFVDQKVVVVVAEEVIVGDRYIKVGMGEAPILHMWTLNGWDLLKGNGSLSSYQWFGCLLKENIAKPKKPRSQEAKMQKAQSKKQKAKSKK